MPRGAGIVAAAATAAVAIVAAGVLVPGTDEDGIRFAVRWTGRLATVVFLVAFSASGLARRWPGPATRGLVAERRFVGLGFAVVLLIHGLLLIALFSRVASARAAVEPATLVVGGIGYLFTALMAATSFDRTADWLGPRWWTRLHRTGVWWLWAIFVLTEGPRFGHVVPSTVLTIALLAAAGLRLRA